MDGALTLLKILDCIGGWSSYALQDLGLYRWMVLLRSRSWTVEVDGALTLLKILDCRVDGALTLLKILDCRGGCALTLLKIFDCRGGWCSYAPQDLGV